MALRELNVAYQTVSIDLGEKHPKVVELNPKGSVPVLVDAGIAIWESNVAMEYLDELYGGRLYSGNSGQRAEIRLLTSYSDSVIGPALRDLVFEKRTNPKDQWDWDLINHSERAWVRCQIQLEQWLNGRDYFTGSFSAAECALLPRFGVAEAYGSFIPRDCTGLQRWFRHAQERDGFSEVYPRQFPGVDSTNLKRVSA